MQSTRHITANVNDPIFQNAKDWFLGQLVNPAIALATAFVVAYFIYGVLEYFATHESGAESKLFKSRLFYGTIGLVIVIGVWTIINTINAFTGSNVQIK